MEYFHSTLPNFWYEGLLEKNGGIYIPFTLHCFQQVLRHYECLRKVYCIKFVKEEQLNENMLWRATKQIDISTMNSIFGKEAEQERIYCGISVVTVQKHSSNGVDVQHMITTLKKSMT